MNKNTKTPPPRIELLDDEELYDASYLGATFGDALVRREPLRLDRDPARRGTRDRK